jgi:hypothetical protein
MRKHIEHLLIFYVKQHVCRVRSVRGLYTHPYRVFTNNSYTLTITNMLTVLNSVITEKYARARNTDKLKLRT